jgi:hypothetical protein
MLSTPAAGQGAELPNLIEKVPPLSNGVYGVGVGIGAGDPTGLSFALRTESLLTVSSMVGWDFKYQEFHVHVDNQFPVAEIQPPESVLALTFFTGIGATVDFGDDAGIGARIPLVAALSIDKPIEVFVEVVPVVSVLPAIELNMQATMGLRSWFQPKKKQ